MASCITFAITNPNFDVAKLYRNQNLLSRMKEFFSEEDIEFAVNGKKVSNQMELQAALAESQPTPVPGKMTDDKNNQQSTALNRLAGIWKDRTDLPDFAALRGGWDRACAP
uniref:Uncharacterized protein n=1 Tax=Candidatus Kentrum sp. FW TaxID=2126338 RepID=A0A450T347_9GAMM|nr:MAG: hypothetical protein BECKFW1821A_GA0114235_11096 [Candidatus Kentron sp. FW]VFJ61995.1 MAG: hypothetical protein BECKFW1821B_GA0114236_10695 [Candidatus Kentron sp. FW]